MKKTLSKFTALLLTALMIVGSWSTQLTAFAAAAPPSQIESSTIYNGLSSGGFDIKFPLNCNSWAESISAVSVGNVDYAKIKYSWDYSSTGQQYLVRASDAELIISEGFDGETAECTIKADGYDDLTLTLDKTSHTAVIKDPQAIPDPVNPVPMALVPEAILVSPVPVLTVDPRAAGRLPAVLIVVPVLKAVLDPAVIRAASLQCQPLPLVNPILANQDI